jgi:alanine dehydrogenase
MQPEQPIGLGASVKVFDASLAKLQNLKNSLGIQLFTSVFSKGDHNKSIQNGRCRYCCN